jgi:hypothetical protein
MCKAPASQRNASLAAKLSRNGERTFPLRGPT